MSDEQEKEQIDQLAKSISGLCHTVIAKRLGQFFEVIQEEVRKQQRDPELEVAAVNLAKAFRLIDDRDYMNSYEASDESDLAHLRGIAREAASTIQRLTHNTREEHP